MKVPYLRLDGKITRPDHRKRIVQRFNDNDRYKVLLMTTQVGGVGLTLTSADRVIIFDPSWTPSDDQQAIDRSHRIGQKKHVVVYRLMTLKNTKKYSTQKLNLNNSFFKFFLCGTVEEKMFRRQVYKTSLINTCQSIDSNDAVTYFSHDNDVSELFQLGMVHTAESAQLLRDVHGQEKLDSHAPDWLLKHVNSLKENYHDNLLDVSLHSQMFTLTNEEIEKLAKLQQEKMQERQAKMSGLGELNWATDKAAFQAAASS